MITLERLREVLELDDDGALRWRVRLSKRAPVGSVAGYASNRSNRRMITIDGVEYRDDLLLRMYRDGTPPIAPSHKTFKGASLTWERLKEILIYNPDTGDFTWKFRPGRYAGHTKPGDPVGSWNDSGYRKMGIDGCPYRAHRVAWLYMTGNWPTGHLDHINRVRGDNRFCNLRPATPSENMRNGPGWAKRTSRLKGTYQQKKGRWRAMITLGTFGTEEEAHAAYMRAARLFFGEFACSGETR